MELCDLSAFEIGRLLRERRASAVEVVNSALGRIEAVDGRAGVLDPGEERPDDKQRVHAFITVTAERPGKRAAKVDRQLAAGEEPGPLAGVPVTVKDIFCVAG